MNAFAKVVEEVLDSLPDEFRTRIRNVRYSGKGLAIMPSHHPGRGGRKRSVPRRFHGVHIRTQANQFVRPPYPVFAE